MPFLLLCFALFLFVPFVSQPAFAHTGPAPAIHFVKNVNQWDKDIKFRAAIPGGFLFVKARSLQYVFYDTKAMGRIHTHDKSSAKARIQHAIAKPELIQAHGFEVVFENASAAAIIEPAGETPDKKNFFLGNNPAAWASQVPAYTSLLYKNIYPGIDLKVYTQHASLKYEFIVSPKADASQISLRYQGAEKLSLQEGALKIQTSVNTVTETKPYCYQPISGKQEEVPAAFQLKGNILRFSFPKGYSTKYPLVIDPFLVFSTYSGSFTDNWGFTATYDDAGNLYSGGIEFGNRFPATNGAFQFNFAGQIDVAVLKYTPDGKSLLYATYLGGVEAELPHSMIVNAANELIVMGTTGSGNFPFSESAFDQDFNGGQNITPLGGVTYTSGSDLYVTKFNAAGDSLMGSTYLGGSNNDGINETDDITKSYGDQFRGEVNIDADGNIYIASTTVSLDFPVVNPAQASLQGERDAIISKFSPDLSSLLWSTYFGGSAADAASGIRIGGSGSVYICGGTTSQDLPVPAGTIKSTFTDGEDGYIAKFSNNMRKMAAYIGTDSRDLAALIDLDASENVYVMGLTFGLYPVSGNVYRNPNSSQFIHALSNDFTQTIFSTVVGSGNNQPNLSPTAFQVSNCGFIYLAGWGGLNGRSTINLPTTPGAIRGSTTGDDFYLMILDTEAKNLLYGTFFGSPGGTNHVDGGTSRFDKKGTIYHAACACRDNNSFPTTPGVWSQQNNGNSNGGPGDEDDNDGCNNVAFKFDLDGLKADFEVSQNGTSGVTEGCAPFTAAFANASLGGITYLWNIAGKDSSTAFNASNFTFDTPGEYKITLIAYNPLTCKKADTVSRMITIYPAAFAISPPAKICPGENTQLKASGGIQYEWAPATGLNDPRSATPIASPLQTTTYVVTITNETGCREQRSVKIEVAQAITADFDLTISSECGKPATVRFVNNSSEGEKILWIMGNGDTLTTNPDFYNYDIKGGTYQVVLTVFKGLCQASISKNIEIESGELPPNVITPNGDKNNETFIAPNNNSRLEIYNRWGKSIYQSDSYQHDWGQEIDNGVYFYLLTSPQGTRCKGWIHVLR